MLGHAAAQSRPLDRRTVRSRARVIAATQELLAERGPAAVTLDAVAERAGVARTTVYRNYGRLPDLIAAALDELGTPADTPDTGDVTADVTEILQGLANALHHTAWGRLVPALLLAAEQDSEFAQAHQRIVQRRRQTLLDALHRGAHRHQIRSDVDIDTLCDTLAGALYYRRLVTRQNPDPATVPALTRQLLTPVLTPSPESTAGEQVP